MVLIDLGRSARPGADCSRGPTTHAQMSVAEKMRARWWQVSPVKRTAFLTSIFVLVAIIGDHFRILAGQSWFLPVELATLILLGIGMANWGRNSTPPPHAQ
jgi:hypothetical protein